MNDFFLIIDFDFVWSNLFFYFFSNIINLFLFSLFFLYVIFLERICDNVMVYDYWCFEYFLFIMDYFFYVVNGFFYK